jgi:arsenite-transporting ATPase
MANVDVEPVDESESDDADAADDGAAEIDVEVTDDLSAELPDRVNAPEYVLYGGKGGVGKTTMAAATALASAAGGTPTLVVSTDPAHSLSDTLETDVPADPAQVRDDVPLYAAEIDPDAAMQGPLGGMGGEGGFAPDDDGGFDADADPQNGPDADPFDDADGSATGAAGTDAGDGPFGGADGPFGGDADGPMGGMADLFGEEGAPLLGGPMPGADEAAAMQQLLRYLDDPRFDRVVIDTAPTGHTLRLLELPEILDSMVGRMVKMRRKFSGMMEGIKGMVGMGDDAGGMGDLDELRDRIEHLREVLRDPDRTDFRVVMIPEEMSVTESERLVRRLDEYGIPVQTVVVNRVMENLADVADVDDEWVVSPDLDHCEFCQRRWQVQQAALRRATDLFRGRDVRRVPLLADEVRGEAALRVVAACLD